MTPLHGPARTRPSRQTPTPGKPLRIVSTSGSRRPRAPFVVLVVALLAIGLVGLLLINTSLQRRAFELTAMEQKAADLQTREQALTLEVQGMSSPDHIATEAARLGMVPNASPAFLRLPDGKITGRPSPALPGTNLPDLSGTHSRDADDRDAAAHPGGDENDKRKQKRNQDKPENRKPDKNKSNENKPNDKKPDNKPNENKPENNKPDNKQPDNKTPDRKPERRGESR